MAIVIMMANYIGRRMAVGGFISSVLKLEDNFNVLLETGSNILLEQQ